MRRLLLGGLLLCIVAVACQPVGNSGSPPPGRTPSSPMPTAAESAESTVRPTVSAAPTLSAEPESPAVEESALNTVSDEEIRAAAFGPPIGQRCSTLQESVALNGPEKSIQMAAVCRLFGGEVDSGLLSYQFETSPRAQDFNGGRGCDLPGGDFSDTWMGILVLYSCEEVDTSTIPYPNNFGLLRASRVTEGELDALPVYRRDLYRKVFEHPVGESCPVAGEMLVSYDLGPYNLKVVCREVVAEKAFYRLESDGDYVPDPDGQRCEPIGARHAAHIAEVDDYRLNFCAEAGSGVGVWQRQRWLADPPGFGDPCNFGAPDYYRTSGSYRLRISCRILQGAPTWAVVEKFKIAG